MRRVLPTSCPYSLQDDDMMSSKFPHSDLDFLPPFVTQSIATATPPSQTSQCPVFPQPQCPYYSSFSSYSLALPCNCVSTPLPLANLFPVTLRCLLYGTFLSSTSSLMMSEVPNQLLFGQCFPQLFLCSSFRDVCPSPVSFCTPALTSYHSSLNPPTTFMSGIVALFKGLHKPGTRESSVSI